MISVDTDTLISLLDRELQFFLAQQNTKRRLILVGRLLEWLEREPRLSALLEEARRENADTALRFREERASIHRAIASLWEKCSEPLRERCSNVTERSALEAHGPVEGFDVRCQAEAELIRTSDFPRQDRTRARNLIDCLFHWLRWTSERGEELPPPLAQVCKALENLDQQEHHAFRRFQAASRSLPGAGLARLEECRKRVELVPPPTGLSEEELGAWWGTHAQDLSFAEAVHSDSAQALARGSVTDPIEDAAREALQDAELVCHALRQQLLVGWSRRAIVQRYAARCQAFESERLRGIAESSRQPEMELTRDFARYLFDQGLTPLIEPTIGRLKPDVVELGNRAMFYVEAKQYRDSSPRAMLIKAFRQVWSTWSRLRQEHHCPEAFLVVFRRSGPLVEVPLQLRWSGLVLHPVLIDLAEDAGSSERQEPIRLSEEELLPSPEE